MASSVVCVLCDHSIDNSALYERHLQEWHHVTLEKERVVRAAMAQAWVEHKEGRQLPGTSLPLLPGTSLPLLPGTSSPLLPGTSSPLLPGTSLPLLPPYSLHHSPMPLVRIKEEPGGSRLGDMDCSKGMAREAGDSPPSDGRGERKRKSEFERNGSPNIKIRRDLVKEEQCMEEEELETEERVMPSLMGPALELARKVGRMLEAFPGGVRKAQFEATYRQVVGEVLDVRKLGFFNTAAYLRSLEGTVVHMNVVDREVMVTRTRVRL